MKYLLLLFLVSCTPSMTYQPPQSCPIKHKKYTPQSVTVTNFVWDKHKHKWVQVGDSLTESMDTVNKNNDTVNNFMNIFGGSKKDSSEPKVLPEDSN